MERVKQFFQGLTFPLVVALTITGSSNILAGFESSIVSFPKDVFAAEQRLKITDERYPWLAAMAPLGAAIGCLPFLSGYLNDAVGRRKALMVTQLVYLLSVLMTSLAPDLVQFLAGRFFAGAAVGAMTTIAPVYMAECTPTALRAGAVAMTQVLIVLGVLLGFAISKPFVTATPKTWAGAFACAAPLAGLLLLVIPLAPESPRWLMAQGKEEEAIKVLRRLRGLPALTAAAPAAAGAVDVEAAAAGTSDSAPSADDGSAAKTPSALAASLALTTGDKEASLAAELAMIRASLAEQAAVAKQRAAEAGYTDGTRYSKLRGLVAQLSAPHILLAMGTGFTLGMFQQMSGMAAINRYSSIILGSGGAGLSPLGAVDAAIILNVWKLVTVVVGDLIVDHLGRRPILIGGMAGMAGSMLAVGGILEANHNKVSGDNSVAVVVLIALYIFFYEVSVGPLLWVLSSEMFPTSIRGVAMSSGSTAVWLFSFAVSYFFPTLVTSRGLDGAFYFFGGWTCIGIVWAVLCVPETHRLPLEAIQEALKKWALLRWLDKATQALGLRPKAAAVAGEAGSSTSGAALAVAAVEGVNPMVKAKAAEALEGEGSAGSATGAGAVALVPSSSAEAEGKASEQAEVTL